MSFPPFSRQSFDRALTQLYNQWLTRVTSSYICTLKPHICTRYLAPGVLNIDIWRKRVSYVGLSLEGGHQAAQGLKADVDVEASLLLGRDVGHSAAL